MSIGLVEGMGPVVDGGTTILPGTSGIIALARVVVAGLGGHPGRAAGAGVRRSEDGTHGGVLPRNREAVSKLFSRTGAIVAHPQRPIDKSQTARAARIERGFVASVRSW
ncbi:MAG TPA: hypothetical protein VEF07_10260 [Candidatus Binataceae bacterium]|nr:hypothetical protein [Candidatus Binataceae bacterium]